MASWMADMLSTAARLGGRRLHPSDCRRWSVQAEKAKALMTSRYARESEARALPGVGPETMGSRIWTAPKRPVWPSSRPHPCM